MINWHATAKSLGFENEKEMWTLLYSQTSISLENLAARFGTSEVVIKTALAQAGIPRRSRGGPNNRKFELLSPKTCDQIRQEGLWRAARRLHVRYRHLLSRLLNSEAFHRRTQNSPPEDED